MEKNEKAIKKVFVLDTNVILHDPECITKFKKHDVVIPITVIEELDKFKKGSEEKNLHTRHFIRGFDKITEDSNVFTDKGTSLGKKKGKIQVKLCSKINSRVKEALAEDIKDHRILSIVCDLVEGEIKGEKRKVIFISKDVNLRIKARALDIDAEDYENDKVASLDLLYTGTSVFSPSKQLAADFYAAKDQTIPLKNLELTSKIVVYPNMYLLSDKNDANVIVRINSKKENVSVVEKRRILNIEPRNIEQVFSFDALMDPELTLVTLSGKAGTGKTLLALVAGIDQVFRKQYDTVLLARPIVELSNKTLGFLPGDAEQKINPYMQPLFDNLSVIKSKINKKSPAFDFVESMQEQEKLKITPLAYIRGRSLNRVFWIIDEAQNLTPHEVKTIITRAGEGTKIVFTGDPEQIDSPFLDSTSNGLSFAIDRWKGQSIYGHVTLTKGERSYMAELGSRIM